MRTVPAFVEKIARAEHWNFPGFILFEDAFALRRFGATGYAARVDALRLKKIGHFLCVPHRHAEHNRRLAFHILAICIDDQLVPSRNLDLALQVKRIVLKTVDAHIAQINVGGNADTAHRHQRIQLNRCFQIQLVRDIFEDIQQIFPVGTLGRGRQPQRKRRIEIRHDLPVCLRCPVVAFVNH